MTLKELNQRAWYRFLKVLYVAAIIPYIGILMVGSSDFFKDGEAIYSLYSKKDIFDEITIDFEPVRELTDKEVFDGPWTDYQQNKQLTAAEINKEMAWLIGKGLLAFVLFTSVYFGALEFIKRSFYYVTIGQVFPKE